MSAIGYINSVALPAALSLLPPKMDTPAARAMVLAIGLQESRFEHRRQIQGPARGFAQFEKGGGVYGVLNHPMTKPLIRPLLADMAYEAHADVVYPALADNDILAMVFARLLLWTHPKALPVRSAPDLAWHYYTSTWRPGKPHRDTWDDFFEQAWILVA